eukprot:TRINITY_DN2165_c0_g1_i2.p1 TRINITY_DN2165_c0_g1~~TRINITY_DN2165_c0_g1_i2.p1  ORF type:complete len:379 (-),score=81.43 TRINITY_DN2165_c0_g1_i2:484-1620(-)
MATAQTASVRPLRMGMLSSSQMSIAVLKPTLTTVPGLIELSAVAARDQARAHAFAAEHGVARVHASYDALLADPDVDAVFIPLPPSLHCYWACRAMESGKHVLVEKPLASNAEEVLRIQQVSAATGCVCMEVMRSYWEAHVILMARLLAAGEIGSLQHILYERWVPACTDLADIRYNITLGGGSTLDTACYNVAAIMSLASAKELPIVSGVESVTAKQYGLKLPKGGEDEIDVMLKANLEFSDTGVTARLTSCPFALSETEGDNEKFFIELQGSTGSLRFDYDKFAPPGAPANLGYKREVVKMSPDGSEELHRWTVDPGSYGHGDVAAVVSFVRAVRGEEEPPCTLAKSLQNTQVMDELYKQAGLQPRGTHQGVVKQS